MASLWYYRKNSTQYGPMESRDLKELATSGWLRPADFIRRDNQTDWRSAGSVKGLFASSASETEIISSPQNSADGATSLYPGEPIGEQLSNGQGTDKDVSATRTSGPPAQWFFVKGKRSFGPFTSQQLKELADKGDLQPDDLVGRLGVPGRRPALLIKGLFSVAPTPLDLTQDVISFSPDADDEVPQVADEIEPISVVSTNEDTEGTVLIDLDIGSGNDVRLRPTQKRPSGTPQAVHPFVGGILVSALIGVMWSIVVGYLLEMVILGVSVGIGSLILYYQLFRRWPSITKVAIAVVLCLIISRNQIGDGRKAELAQNPGVGGDHSELFKEGYRMGAEFCKTYKQTGEHFSKQEAIDHAKEILDLNEFAGKSRDPKDYCEGFLAAFKAYFPE